MSGDAVTMSGRGPMGGEGKELAERKEASGAVGEVGRH